MSNSRMVPAQQQGAPANPFARGGLPSHISAGAVEIESQRAIAEAQGKLVIAKRFPRDENAAYAKIMQACSRPGLAEEAIYSFPRGTQRVTGPSIRLAEELARCWGNIDYGIRELSRRDGESEMEAYAWDLETNTITSQKFTVRHIRDRNSANGGAQVLTDERDIYEIGANMGARRLRARLLAIIPGDIIDAATEQCRATLRGDSEVPLADRIRSLVAEFGKLGVKQGLIETRAGKKVDELTPDDLVDLRGIYKSLRDGHSTVGEWFKTQATAPSSSADAANNAAAAAAAAATAGAPAASKPGSAKPKAAPPANDNESPASDAVAD